MAGVPFSASALRRRLDVVEPARTRWHWIIPLAVAVVAALPTAQNIFIQAAAYNRAVVLSRDTIFVTTVLSVPVVLALTALLA